jgi:hypothetical protein
VLELLAGALSRQQVLLLVLDNCEHVLDAVGPAVRGHAAAG